MDCGLHTQIGAEIIPIIQSAWISLHVRVFDLPNEIVCVAGAGGVLIPCS
jgi:hypothetical protein